MDNDEWICVVLLVKYLWLLFDLAVDGENMVENGPYQYIFTTEGHIFSMSPEISLTTEHCTYVGSFCSGLEYKLNDAKIDLRGVNELHANESTVDKGWFPAQETRQVGEGKYDVMPRLIKGVCPGLSHWRKFEISSLADSVAAARQTNKYPQHDADNQHMVNFEKSSIVTFFNNDDQVAVGSETNDLTRKHLSNSISLYDKDLFESGNADAEGNEKFDVTTIDHLQHVKVNNRNSYNASNDSLL